MQLCKGALHPHAGGVLRKVQACAHMRQRQIGEKAQQHRFAIAFIQLPHRFIDQRAQFPPRGRVGVIGVGEFMHETGLLFSCSPSALGAQDFVRGKSCRRMQPAGEGLVAEQSCGPPREKREHFLRHVFGCVGLRTELSPGSVIHESEIAAHQFGKSVLPAFTGKTPEQRVIVGCKIHLQLLMAYWRGNRTIKT
ncbi:MAG TPA: hypothetical protein VIO16_14665, partial [Dehalococcoidia bacterium]